ncbi:AMP-binding protein [Gryllotalpicola sp.]|uniref:AMP-binding protein n=1 Tax=Gryllotalpicola sp. TaxID=1932787 RepID=UPI00260C2EEA|nr:AMP-binding protein [Gryllotalpicola sp.]
MTVHTSQDSQPHDLGPHTAADRDRYYAEGWWQDRVLYDFLKAGAAQHPERVFVSDGTVTATYGSLRDDVVRLAVGLRSLGVERGDRVAVQLPNWAEFVTIMLALSRLGAILVPIMPIFRKEEVGYILRHSEAVVVIGPAFFHKFSYGELYRELRPSAPALRDVVIVRSDDPVLADDFIAFDTLFAEGDVEELDAALGATATADDGCLLVYTSGTTSRPKGCYHTFNTLHSAARAVIDVLEITPDDVVFNPSPVAHSTGLVVGIVIPLVAGAGTHFQPVWDADDGLRRIERYGCTFAFTATTFLTTLMEAYEEGRHDVSTMRYWVCAGAPIPGPVVQAARALFPDLATLSLYGRTENLATTICRPNDPPERSVTSDGRVIPGGLLKIVGPDDVEVPIGEEGDIAFRGPSLMLGYYREPAETELSYTADGFSKSGDLGYVDEAGFVRVSGRVKDIIIRGGLNISAREVEDLLSGHPAIREIAVVAMPDPRLGEKACAFVVVNEGYDLTLEVVTGFLREQRVAVQKLPERLEIMESLPMTAVGKVRKNLLREMIADKLKEEGVIRA